MRSSIFRVTRDLLCSLSGREDWNPPLSPHGGAMLNGVWSTAFDFNPRLKATVSFKEPPDSVFGATFKVEFAELTSDRGGR